jgi:hypothetical protein
MGSVDDEDISAGNMRCLACNSHYIDIDEQFLRGLLQFPVAR